MEDNVICIQCVIKDSELERLREELAQVKKDRDKWKDWYEQEERACSTCGGTFGSHSLFCEA